MKRDLEYQCAFTRVKMRPIRTHTACLILKMRRTQIQLIQLAKKRKNVATDKLLRNTNTIIFPIFLPHKLKHKSKGIYRELLLEVICHYTLLTCASFQEYEIVHSPSGLATNFATVHGHFSLYRVIKLHFQLMLLAVLTNMFLQQHGD